MVLWIQASSCEALGMTLEVEQKKSNLPSPRLESVARSFKIVDVKYLDRVWALIKFVC